MPFALSLDLAWKNAVLRSPSLSQSIRDLYFSITSSLDSSSEICFIRCRSSLGGPAPIDCPLIRSRSFQNCARVFRTDPNVVQSQSHRDRLSSPRWPTSCPSDTWAPRFCWANSTACMYVGSWHHIFSYMKRCLPRLLVSRPLVHSRTRQQWSNSVVCTCQTLTSLNKSRKAEDARPLSSHTLMLSLPCCLLSQV